MKLHVVAMVAVLCVFTAFRVARDFGRSPKPNVPPRWSCRHAGPPVEEVPLTLVTLAGFRNRAQLREFSDSNRVPLQWTHAVIKSAMIPLERKVRECFRGVASEETPQTDEPLAEVWLTYRLTSDGDQARAEGLQIARTFGRPPYQTRAQRCIEEEMLGRTIETGKTNRPLLVYRGLFPFYRKMELGGSAARIAQGPRR